MTQYLADAWATWFTVAIFAFVLVAGVLGWRGGAAH